MVKKLLLQGLLVGAITSLPVAAILFLFNQLVGFPFIPFDIFDWLARVLPGDIITLGIDSIVSVINLAGFEDISRAAKFTEQLMALGMFVVGGSLFGVFIALLVGRSKLKKWQVGMGAGLIGFLSLTLIEINLGQSDLISSSTLWIALIMIAWGLVLAGSLAKLSASPESESDMTESKVARRAFLYRLAAGSAGIALGAWGLGRLFATPQEELGAAQPLADLAATPRPETTPTSESAGQVSQALPTSTPAVEVTPGPITRDKLSPVPGTRAELTPNDEFYRIDINTRPVTIDLESWLLEIRGEFEQEVELSLDDLLAYPPITQAITLSCISNRVGGSLIGTSNWTGVRLRDLVADLALKNSAIALLVEAEDGFYESVGMMDLMDPRTLLVYGMNDETLPVEHGFPLRIYIPDRYGMKQPKWIRRITAIPDNRDGYWVVRGWSKEARPQIVSVIDAIATNDLTPEGLIPTGGIAWAGERGIQKVELKLDEGPWFEATLRTPPLSPLTWVQWRYDLAAEPGRHTLQVRATDGSGAKQIEEESGPRPDGATGYHSQDFRL